MKQKIFMLLAAVLLSSASMFAQSNEPLKGDVNGDGVVDVADVVAVIDIIAKSQNDSETTYYWYVGQTDPSTMSSISPIVDNTPIEHNDETRYSAGWREIGSIIGTYDLHRPLWNSILYPITSSPSTKAAWYVAVPSISSLGVHDSEGVLEVNTGNWTTEQQITIAGITYNVYKSVGTSRNFNVWFIY